MHIHELFIYGFLDLLGLLFKSKTFSMDHQSDLRLYSFGFAAPDYGV